jgi:hypothetical protein
MFVRDLRQRADFRKERCWEGTASGRSEIMVGAEQVAFRTQAEEEGI